MFVLIVQLERKKNVHEKVYADTSYDEKKGRKTSYDEARSGKTKVYSMCKSRFGVSGSNEEVYV